MPQMSREEVASIIDREMPGYHVVSPDEPLPADAEPAGGADAPDAGTPDLDQLRRKYLHNPGAGGGTAADRAEAAAAAAPGADSADDAEDDTVDDEIVAVEPDDRTDPWDRAKRPKSVVVGKEGIIGSQG